MSNNNKQSIVLIRLIIALFLSYLSVAFPLTVVSVYVRYDLGFSDALAGLAVSIVFLSTIFSRGIAGSFSDKRGGKKSMVFGLVMYVIATCICLIAVLCPLSNMQAYVLLLAGRFWLGVGESFTIVGVSTWGIAVLSASSAGRVMSWVGVAMYGALALGAPFGLFFFEQCNFSYVLWVSLLFPLVGLLFIITLDGDNPHFKQGQSKPFFYVLTKIWKFGTVVALQGIGFAGISAFIALYFMANQWSYSGVGLTFFGVGFVFSRLVAGQLPDKIGGVKVAFFALLVEVVGQTLLWQASAVYIALLGTLLTGVGCSLVYPAMGVEVVKRIDPQLRGTAIGGFAAFQDLSYGITAPIIGLFTMTWGYSVTFLIGLCAALLGILIVCTEKSYQIKLTE